jgi:hypothetical protein
VYYLEILSNVEDSSDIQGIFFVKVTERISQIRWLDLPDPHKDELMVWMASQEHGKKFSGVLEAYVTPRRVLQHNGSKSES